MAYPFTWVDATSGLTLNSYADVATVQQYFATYTISAGDQDHIGTASVLDFLVSTTAEIDAVCTAAGYLMPPPAGSAIMPI